MANRQSAPTGARADAREDTARVVMHKSTLPGWFWGALGFLSVLAVGFGALLFVAKNGVLGGVAPAPAATATAAAPTAAGPATRPGVQSNRSRRPRRRPCFPAPARTRSRGRPSRTRSSWRDLRQARTHPPRRLRPWLATRLVTNRPPTTIRRPPRSRPTRPPRATTIRPCTFTTPPPPTKTTTIPTTSTRGGRQACGAAVPGSRPSSPVAERSSAARRRAVTSSKVASSASSAERGHQRADQQRPRARGDPQRAERRQRRRGRLVRICGGRHHHADGGRVEAGHAPGHQLLHVRRGDGRGARSRFEEDGRPRRALRLGVDRQRIGLFQHQVNARAHHAVDGLQRPLDLAGRRVEVAGPLLGRRRDQARLPVRLGESAPLFVRQAERAQRIDRAGPVAVGDADRVAARRAREAPSSRLLGADPGALQRARRVVRSALVDPVQDVRRAGRRRQPAPQPAPTTAPRSRRLMAAS